MNQWPLWLGYALWADQIMVKKNTGYSPYYLLYGQHLLLLFNVANSTFHILDWPKVMNTIELLALHMQQLDQRYKKGELIIVYNEALDNQMSSKGTLKWCGPYAVVAR